MHHPVAARLAFPSRAREQARQRIHLCGFRKTAKTVKNGEKRSINGWKTVRIRSENGRKRWAGTKTDVRGVSRPPRTVGSRPSKFKLPNSIDLRRTGKR